jgi:ABC-type antimicrobial peptide transport system permease subunit
MVLRQGTWVVILGSVLGLGGSMIGGRLVRDLLYETRPFEPVVAVSVAILVVIFGVVAMIAPAVRAGRIEPAVTLRSE